MSLDWDRYEKCVNWAKKHLGDEDAARDLALAVLEDVAEKKLELNDTQLYHRIKWRATDVLRATNTAYRKAAMSPRLATARAASKEPTPDQHLSAKQLHQQLCDAAGEQMVNAVTTGDDAGLNQSTAAMRRSRLRRTAKEVLK